MNKLLMVVAFSLALSACGQENNSQIVDSNGNVIGGGGGGVGGGGGGGGGNIFDSAVIPEAVRSSPDFSSDQGVINEAAIISELEFIASGGLEESIFLSGFSEPQSRSSSVDSSDPLTLGGGAFASKMSGSPARLGNVLRSGAPRGLAAKSSAEAKNEDLLLDCESGSVSVISSGSKTHSFRFVESPDRVVDFADARYTNCMISLFGTTITTSGREEYGEVFFFEGNNTPGFIDYYDSRAEGASGTFVGSNPATDNLEVAVRSYNEFYQFGAQLIDELSGPARLVGLVNGRRVDALLNFGTERPSFNISFNESTNALAYRGDFTIETSRCSARSVNVDTFQALVIGSDGFPISGELIVTVNGQRVQYNFSGNTVTYQVQNGLTGSFPTSQLGLAPSCF